MSLFGNKIFADLKNKMTSCWIKVGSKSNESALIRAEKIRDAGKAATGRTNSSQSQASYKPQMLRTARSHQKLDGVRILSRAFESSAQHTPH